MGKGFLKIHIFVGDDALPLEGVNVIIRDANGQVLNRFVSDQNGLTDIAELYAPDKEYSLEPNSGVLPFATYDAEAEKEGFQKTIIHDVEIFDGETSILPIQMLPKIRDASPQQNINEIYIPLEHGIDFERDFAAPQRILGPIAPLAADSPARYEVPVPQYITVHLGSPNAAAQNVRLPFIDYIKNVASSEIFPTWDEAALYANIFSQISFALNRIYTVWYRSRGFDFDITNSTAFDQYFIYGRNIFENISRIVDGIFNNFIQRRGRREPFFAQYCNGTTSTCDGLSQWGSQDLATQGYTSMQILRYYFPNDIQIVESNNFRADIGAFGGVPLKEGDSGPGVRTMQTYLNRISGNFYIPAISAPNGFFGATTTASVKAFQSINNLIPDGIVGKSTWYAITKIYVAVKRLAELSSEGERFSIGAAPPTVTLQTGSRGEYVVELQFLLNMAAEFYPTVPPVIQDSVFRDSTKRSLVEFQKQFGLSPDGVVGPATWQKLYSVYHSIRDSTPPADPPIAAFPGTPLRIGSRGSDVLLMQNHLNAIAQANPAIPAVTADGIFGPATEAAVKAFQQQAGLTPDGIIGQITWYQIVEVYNALGNAPSPDTQVHAVVAGDTLYALARRFGTTVQALKALNNLNSDALHIGQKLLVPQASGSFSHTVRAGDTLYALARDNNTTVQAIITLNNLTSNVLYIGQTLTIPR